MSESRFSVERSNYSIQEYIVHHRYITTAMMSGVVMTTMTILMTYYATKNYCIHISLTDANLVIIKLLMHDYHLTSPFYKTNLPQLMAQKDKFQP